MSGVTLRGITVQPAANLDVRLTPYGSFAGFQDATNGVCRGVGMEL